MYIVVTGGTVEPHRHEKLLFSKHSTSNYIIQLYFICIYIYIMTLDTRYKLKRKVAQVRTII